MSGAQSKIISEGLPASRSEAIRQGKTHYFSGVECRRGHVAVRGVHKGCLQCRNENAISLTRRKRTGNPTFRANLNRKKVAAYYQNHESSKAKDRAWYAKNRKRPQKIPTYHSYPIITKTEAKGRGLKRYYTGVPCKSGHDSERYISGKCVQCNLTEEAIALQRQAGRNFKINNPEKVRDSSARAHARRKCTEGGFTAADIVDIRRRQNKRCAYCKARFTRFRRSTLDHIVPVVKGGTNNRQNLQLTCHSCNAKKHATDAHVFARKLGLLI